MDDLVWYNIHLMQLLLLLLMSDGLAWGFSYLWCGGIAILDIDHSVPRLCHLELNFNLAHPPQLFFLSLLGSYLPLFPTASPSSAIHCWIPLVPPSPRLLSRCKARPSWALPAPPHPPASVACPCTLRRVLVSAAASRAVALPPLPPSDFTQIPVRTWGVFPSRVRLHLCVPASLSPSSPMNLDIVHFWDRCWVDFSENSIGQGASTPWQLRNLVLSPHYLDIPDLFSRSGSPLPFPPSPSPPCCRDPIPVGSRSVDVPLEVSVKGACIIHGRRCLVCKTKGQIYAVNNTEYKLPKMGLFH